MNKAINFSLCFILVISFPVISEASQIDFAWSTPEFLSYRKDSEDEKRYYEDKYIPEIAGKVSEGVEKYISEDEMKGEFGPGVTKKGSAIFEDIDPHAKKINILVTGLSHLLFWKLGQVDYTYKITYNKSGDKWILGEYGFSKDSSHRNYTDKFE